MEELLVDAQIPCDPCIAKNLQCKWFCSWWCWRQRRTNVDIWDTLLWGFEPRAFVWPCRGEDWLRLFLSPHRQFGTQYRHLLSAIKELIPKSGRGGYRIRKTLWSETSKQNTLLSIMFTLGSLNHVFHGPVARSHRLKLKCRPTWTTSLDRWSGPRHGRIMSHMMPRPNMLQLWRMTNTCCQCKIGCYRMLQVHIYILDYIYIYGYSMV